MWTSSKLEKLVKDWRKDAVNDFEDNYEQVVPDLADSFLYQYGNSLRDYFNKIISGAIKISFKENIEPYRRMYDHKAYIKCKTCNKIIYPSKTQYCSKPCEVIGEL